MRVARSTIFLLFVVTLSVCTAAAENATVKQDMIPGWKLGYEHLDILSIALDQRSKSRTYALHAINDPILTANTIVKTWRLSRADDEYEVIESDYFVKSERRDGAMSYYNVLNYAIYSEKGKFVLELEKVDSSEGEIQFLVRPEGKGIIVNVYDSGRTTQKAYDELPAPYGCPNSKLRTLTHDEEFSYTAFGVDSLNVTTFINRAIREDDLLKIVSKSKRGAETEMTLNKDLEVIRMRSEGLEFEKCSVETALSERGDSTG